MRRPGRFDRGAHRGAGGEGHDRCVDGICADHVGVPGADAHVSVTAWTSTSRGRSLPAIYALGNGVWRRACPAARADAACDVPRRLPGIRAAGSRPTPRRACGFRILRSTQRPSTSQSSGGTGVRAGEQARCRKPPAGHPGGAPGPIRVSAAMPAGAWPSSRGMAGPFAAAAQDQLPRQPGRAEGSGRRPRAGDEHRDGIAERFTGPRVLACGPVDPRLHLGPHLPPLCEEPGSEVLHADFGDPYIARCAMKSLPRAKRRTSLWSMPAATARPRARA